MKLKYVIYLFLVGSFILLEACSHHDDLVTPETPTIVQEGLSDRVSTSGAGVVGIKGVPDSASVVTRATTDGYAANELPLVMLAEVTPPSQDGVALRATHVDIEGNYAYVSYNMEGDTYLGAIDVIDITDPENPSVVMEAVFPGTDISSVISKGDYLYVAGASEDLNDGGENPALLMRLDLSNGSLADSIDYIDMPGYVATDVIADDSYWYGVSGDNGILAAYSLTDNSLVNSVEIPDLRAVASLSERIVALSGEGRVYVVSPGTLASVTDFATLENNAEAKRTIDLYLDEAFVAEGQDGVGIYNLLTGSEDFRIPIILSDSTGIDPDELVSNAVSVNSGYIYIANGAGGVSVYGIPVEYSGLSSLTTVGTLDLDGSANYVVSRDNYVFVADGTGGLKILNILSASDEDLCTDYETYTGTYWLNTSIGDNLAYTGVNTLVGINVNNNSVLSFCGVLAVSNYIHVNNDATFYMKGNLIHGSLLDSGTKIIVNANATMQIEGNLTVYGELVLNNNSTLEFIGDNSSLTVYGSVSKHNGATVVGTFTDTFGSLD